MKLRNIGILLLGIILIAGGLYFCWASIDLIRLIESDAKINLFRFSVEITLPLVALIGIVLIYLGLKVLISFKWPNMALIKEFLSFDAVPPYLRDDPIDQSPDRSQIIQGYSQVSIDQIAEIDRVKMNLRSQLKAQGIQNKEDLYYRLRSVESRKQLAESLGIERELIDTIWVKSFTGDEKLTEDMIHFRSSIIARRKRSAVFGTLFVLSVFLMLGPAIDKLNRVYDEKGLLLRVMSFIDHKRPADHYKIDIEEIKNFVSQRRLSIDELRPIELGEIIRILFTLLPTNGGSIEERLLKVEKKFIKPDSDFVACRPTILKRLSPFREKKKKVCGYLLTLKGLIKRDLSKYGTMEDVLEHAIRYFEEAQYANQGRIGTMNGLGTCCVMKLFNRGYIDAGYLRLAEKAQRLFEECLSKCENNSISYARSLNNQCDICFDIIFKMMRDSVDYDYLKKSPYFQSYSSIAVVFEKAFANVDKAIRRFPNEPRIYITKMQALSLLGDCAFMRNFDLTEQECLNLLEKRSLPKERKTLTLVIADSAIKCLEQAEDRELDNYEIFERKNMERSFLRFFLRLEEFPTGSEERNRFEEFLNMLPPEVQKTYLNKE